MDIARLLWETQFQRTKLFLKEKQYEFFNKIMHFWKFKSALLGGTQSVQLVVTLCLLSVIAVISSEGLHTTFEIAAVRGNVLRDEAVCPLS